MGVADGMGFEFWGEISRFFWDFWGLWWIEERVVAEIWDWEEREKKWQGMKWMVVSFVWSICEKMTLARGVYGKRETEKRVYLFLWTWGWEWETEEKRERVNTFSREFMDSFSLLPLFPVFLWEEKRKF